MKNLEWGINMFFFITSGTVDYMEKLRNKYSTENIFVLHGTGNSLLLHESENKKSKFATPRKHEVIDQSNQIEQRGYFVLNHIPVSDEGRPIFEKRFLERSREIEKEPGFIAYRLLRPLDSDTYIVLTQWTGPNSYDAWKNSNSFINAHGQKQPGERRQNIFNAASYVTTYSGKLSEEK